VYYCNTNNVGIIKKIIVAVFVSDALILTTCIGTNKDKEHMVYNKLELKQSTSKVRYVGLLFTCLGTCRLHMKCR